METYEAILARRSIRSFTDEPVSDEAIDRLLKSAMAAPSACNKRPWEFYVVKNPALQEKLRHTTMFSNLNSSLIIVVAGNDKRSLAHRVNDYWIQDCSAAVENMLLTAVELGLGSCWCGLFPMATPVKRVRETLELPEHIIPMAMLHFGHPKEVAEPRTQYEEKRVHMIE